MVAVAAGKRAGAAGGRRRSGCSAGQAQQRMLAVAVAARFADTGPPPSAEASGAGEGCCCIGLLDCLLGAMGAVAPAPAEYNCVVRSICSRDKGASAEGRRPEAPSGFIAGNGASAAASLYTKEGNKGVNQDAMVVCEVDTITSFSRIN